MSALQQLPDWRPRLQAYVATCVSLPFKAGTHDCALFWAGAVAAMTGHDPAVSFRGRYRTLKGGLLALKRAGFRNHVEAVAGLLTEIPPAYARAGDTAVVAGDGEIAEALGIVQGEMIYVLRPDGLGLVPLTSALRAFRL